jgi:hypothetical protein
MAWSGRAKFGAAAAAVLAVAVAGGAWVASRPDAPVGGAPLTATQSASAAKGGKNVAATQPEKIKWKDLSPAQQQALEPLAGEWDQMEAVRKQKWLGIVKRYASMKPDEQARVQERMREWVRMTPEERRQVRQNFARAQKLDPSQKSTSWESYQQLSDEQKKELAAKAAVKKQVANLPSAAQSKLKTVAPIKPVVAAGTSGTAVAGAGPAVPAPLPVAAPAADGPPLPNASNVTPIPPVPAPAVPAPAPANVK